MRAKLVTAMIAMLLMAFAAPALADSHESQVTVIHGIPGVTVDVWANGEPLIEGFEPDTVTDPLDLPADTYEIEIYETGADPEEADPVISASPEVPGGESLSVIAHLDADGQPTLSAFVNDVSEIDDGNARLTARHTAAAPEVDVRADGDALFEGVSNGDEGTVEVPAGDYSADVALAGEDESVIGPTDLSLDHGTHYLVYAVGSADDGSLDLLVQAISGLGPDAPQDVPAGSGGLVDAFGVPLWVPLALLAGAAASVGGGLTLARARR